MSLKWVEDVGGDALAYLIERCINLTDFTMVNVCYDSDIWMRGFSSCNQLRSLEITGTEAGLNNEVNIVYKKFVHQLIFT